MVGWVGWYGCMVGSCACNQMSPGSSPAGISVSVKCSKFLLPGLYSLSTGTGRL